MGKRVTRRKNRIASLSCPHCTNQHPWPRSCCLCRGRRRISVKTFERVPMSAWSVPGCHCDACKALRIIEGRLR